ncbi:MAG TPA: metabolite traffic protein EboE, partial [Fibrobacteria bacterium]|nr:metabolite traffic protein EboE [Fibrobacteria bacterium]
MKKHRLTYCSNVHPLQNEAVWREKIGFFGPKLAELTRTRPFPMGLWFNQGVLSAVHASSVDLRDRLTAWGVDTFTFNAFPQGDFHQPVVKRAVYLPDWTDPARLEYTKQCAELMAALLPGDEEYGSISTLPLGWREGWTPEHSAQAAGALVDLALFLRDLKANTGRLVALAIEPEPGCVLERTPQVIAFWNQVLRPAARMRDGDATAAVEEHVGLCYDTCHQAVQFEDAEESLAALAAAKIPVRKMQLSSALEFPADPEGASRAAREAFVEPKFLHQTRVKTPEGVFEIDDLPQALNAGPGLFAHPWRVHYHVPVHADTLLDGAIR